MKQNSATVVKLFSFYYRILSPCLKMSPRVFLVPTTKEMVEPLPIHIAVKCLGFQQVQPLFYSETIGEIGDLLGEELETK